jgi:aminopeptidase N
LNTDEKDFRLPRDVVPTRYELTIAPDLGAATFVGHERINLDVSSETRSIVCNAKELQISRATLNSSGSPSVHRGRSFLVPTFSSANSRAF